MTDLDSTRHKLFASLAILFGLLVIGTYGFQVIDNDRSLFECVYLTVVILSTVGMNDSGTHLSQLEQAWAIILMLVGICAVLYAGGLLVAFMIDGELRQMLGRRQLQNKIKRLDNHIIVCGFGRMGRALCASLQEMGVPFLLVESDPERTAQADQLGYLYVLSDAMSEEGLSQSRIETARGLAACLRDDADNVFITLSARALNNKLTIISRSERTQSNDKLRRAGADRVICLPVLGATRMTHMLLQPAVDELLEAVVSGNSDLTISRVGMDQLPAGVGRTLSDLALPAEAGLMVVAVVHPTGQKTFNPSVEYKLVGEDELILIGPTSGLDRLMQKLGTQEA